MNYAISDHIPNAFVSVLSGSWQENNGNVGHGGSSALFQVDTLTPAPPPPGTTADMILRGTNSAPVASQYEIYDIDSIREQARGRELVRAIIPKVDVLVENFTPGVMARAGLGYDELSAIHPALIMCSISLAGQTGPLSRKPGFDYVGAAYAGITSLIGEADRGPAQFATAIGDHATGVTAAMSIGFALLHRERTGEGQYIECSLIDGQQQHGEGHSAHIVGAVVAGLIGQQIGRDLDWVEDDRMDHDGPSPARFRTIQVYPKDKGALGGHTRSVDRPKPLNDALGSKGERSSTTIRQAPGG